MDALVTVHLALAIGVVLTLLVALGSLLAGGWSERAGKAMGLLAGLATGQWVLGLLVWFTSIGDDFNPFTGIIHPLAMTGVVAVAHIANGRRKTTEDVAMRATGARNVLLVMALLLAVAVPWAQIFEMEETGGTGGGLGGGGTGMANPASTFCIDQGGTLEIVDEPDGQVGYCVLPDGTRVEEWAYYRSMNPEMFASPSAG